MRAERPAARRAWTLLAAATLWLVVAAVAALRDVSVASGLSLAIGAALLAAGYVVWRGADAERRRWQQMVDAMEAAIVVYDRDERLVLANADFARLYRLTAADLAPGTRFEDLLRSRVAAGQIPEASGREEDWIAERLRQRRAGGGLSVLRQMANGRWRRIVEQRLADGGTLAYSIDVTELVDNRRALEDARNAAEAAHRALGDALDAMPAAVEVYDANDRLVLYNRRMLALYPHMRGPADVGQTFESLVRRALALGKVPQAAGRESQWLAERLAMHAAHQEVPRLQQAPDGSWVHIYETRTAAGGVIVVRLDVSEMVRQQEAQRTSHALLHDAVEALPEGFALYDRDDRFVLCNQRYFDLYPETAPAIVPGASFESIIRYGLDHGQYPQAASDPQSWLTERLRRHRETSGEPILQELPGNRWLRIDERRTLSGGIAGVRTDVTEMVQSRQQLEALRTQLEQLSITDALTGLANRRHFDVRLNEETERARRHGTPLALLMIDVDHFKRFNDRNGHVQGDAALQAVAHVLHEQARRPGELAARYGGEEFALLLPHVDAEQARQLAQRCVAAVNTAALSHGASHTAAHVTISVGAALYRAATRESAKAWIQRADAALYDAKSQGRARAVMADA